MHEIEALCYSKGLTLTLMRGLTTVHKVHELSS